MATYDALGLLPDGAPGPWGDPVSIRYDQRDVLLYAVGVGVTDLRYVYEGHPEFSVFPTFPIRWGSVGAPIDDTFDWARPGHRQKPGVRISPTRGRVLATDLIAPASS